MPVIVMSTPMPTSYGTAKHGTTIRNALIRKNTMGMISGNCESKRMQI